MTEHLPECWTKFPELRACEKRLLEGRPDPGISEKQAIANYAIYQNGYAAAREALLALPEYALRDTCVAAIDALKKSHD